MVRIKHEEDDDSRFEYAAHIRNHNFVMMLLSVYITFSSARFSSLSR